MKMKLFLPLIILLLATIAIAVTLTSALKLQRQHKRSDTTPPTNRYSIPSLTPEQCKTIFNGIGGLSGGGATSVFLRSYPEPQRSQLLDYLFKPNFGASLHILKVEIGSGADSTDGSEPSIMNSPWELRPTVGYELWLMQEAVKRNPSILLYGLPWGFPRWVACAPGTLTNCSTTPYSDMARMRQTVEYVATWLETMRANLGGRHIDYVGIWNERAYNTTYIKMLRQRISPNTKIVAADDAGWGIADSVLQDKELAEAVYALGSHYPGTTSSANAKKTNKPLWASEDDSTLDTAGAGAGCLARIINENYVNGAMSATINWNLLSAYPKGTRWYRAGMANALKPWAGGAYGTLRGDAGCAARNGSDTCGWSIGPMIWAAAHTTQFARPGWRYIPSNASGPLALGGSMVVLKNFASSNTSHPGGVSIIIEKMSRDRSSCVRPALPYFPTAAERARITIDKGVLPPTASGLHFWKTVFAFSPTDNNGTGRTTEFEYQGMLPLQLSNSGESYHIDIDVQVNSIITLTTVPTGNKGSFPQTTASRIAQQNPVLFPAAHIDNFDNCRVNGEANYFSDQNGNFVCVASEDGSGRGMVMRQVVPLRPITWSGDTRPHSFIGHRDAVNTSFTIAGRIRDQFSSSSSGLVIGVRCSKDDATVGLLFTMDATGGWNVWTNIQFSGSPLASGRLSQFAGNAWHIYRIDANGTQLNVWVDGSSVVSNLEIGSSVSFFASRGFALIGTLDYANNEHEFDEMQLYSSFALGAASSAASPPAVGDAICNMQCSAEVGVHSQSVWRFDAVPNGRSGGPAASTLELRLHPGLCARATPAPAGQPQWLQLAQCNSSDPQQLWKWFLDGIAPDSERQSFIYVEPTPGNRLCIDLYNQVTDINVPVDAWPCNTGFNQAFYYDYDAGQVGNEASASCIGVCAK